VANIQREVAVLSKLRGTLNVVALEGAWEDDAAIHIVMEYCRGGELLHSISSRPHYSEQTVASIMRAVLRTAAQCHAGGILHRDIKPGNFMFLDDRPDAPIKAIDFGLAAFFEAAGLPRTDLGLEGTPWFMAPEVLSSKVGPPADVWSAGVMAYQLLCGRLPFDDWANPGAPALSKIWKAILGDPPRMEGAAWADVSAPAKAFVVALLAKDPAARPTARAALRHPWLAGDVSDRYKGRPLRATVVQRVQRFAAAPALQRSIFELMAAEVLRLAPGSPGGSGHGSGEGSGRGGGEAGAAAPPPPGGGGGALAAALAGAPPPALPPAPGPGFGRTVSVGSLLHALRASGPPLPPPSPSGSPANASGSARWGSATAHAGMEFLRWRAAGGEGGAGSVGSGGGGASFGGASNRRASNASAPGGMSGAHTLHGGADYWRIMRAAAAAAVVARAVGGSLHGGRGGGGGPGPASAAALDAAMTEAPFEGSGHGANEYLRTAARTAVEKGEQRKAARLMLDTSHHAGADYQRLVRTFLQRRPSLDALRASGEELRHKPAGGSSGSGSGGAGVAPPPSQPACPPAPTVAAMVAAPPGASPPLPAPPGPASLTDSEESGRRRQGAYAQFLSAGSGGGGGSRVMVDENPASPRPAPPFLASPSRMRTPSRVAFAGAAGDMDLDGPAAPPPPPSPASLLAEPASPSADDSAGEGPASGTVSLSELRDIMRRLNFGHADEALTASALADGLGRLGYRVDPAEAAVLAEAMTGRRATPASGGGAAAGPGGTSPRVPRAAFAASQLDWSTLQTNYRDLWLTAAQRVFADLGGDASAPDSSISPSALVEALRAKLPAAAVDYAVEDALLDAGLADAEALDFEGFLRLLRTSGGALGPNPGRVGDDPEASVHGLSQYDARLARPFDGGSGGAGGAGGGSTHGPGRRGSTSGLEPVAEERK